MFVFLSDRTKSLDVTEEEIMHRRSLSTARSLLKEMSARETELGQGDRSATTFDMGRESVKPQEDNECTSSQNLIKKEASDCNMVNKDKKTLKRERSLRSAEVSMCPRTSSKHKDQKQAEQTNMHDRKKRRVEVASTGQASFLGRKKTVPKTVCINSLSEKGVSRKSKTRRARFKSPPLSPEEIKNDMLHAPDKDITRRGNSRSKCFKPHPTKKDIVQVATTTQPATSDTGEKDSFRKSRYQLPLPDFTFSEPGNCVLK